MVSSDSYDGLTLQQTQWNACIGLRNICEDRGADGNKSCHPDYASDNIHEENSLGLKLVQVLDLSEDCGYQIFV